MSKPATATDIFFPLEQISDLQLQLEVWQKKRTRALASLRATIKKNLPPGTWFKVATVQTNTGEIQLRFMLDYHYMHTDEWRKERHAMLAGLMPALDTIGVKILNPGTDDSNYQLYYKIPRI